MGLHCGYMHVHVHTACAVVSFVFIHFGIWSGVSEYPFACNLSYLQPTLLLGGGLIMYLNTYCFSFSLHLSNLIRYPPPTSQRQHWFHCRVSWPSCVSAADVISEDKSYLYIFIVYSLALFLYYTYFWNSSFFTFIWSYMCLLQSEYDLESVHAVQQKCTTKTSNKHKS